MTGSRHGSWVCWATRGLLLASAIGAFLPALAQDDLYGASAAPDAAWLRAVNAEASGGLGIRVADGPLESVTFGHATAYQVVAPGSVVVDLGGELLTIDVEAGSFVTVVATVDGPQVILDTALVDVSRGLLALYNLTSIAALELVVVDGPSVVSDVAPGSQAAVPVAEAEVALEVRADDEVLGTVDTRLFERGVAHSVMVVEGPDGPLVRYVRAVAAE